MQTIEDVKKHCRVVGEGIVEYHAAEGRREAIAIDAAMKYVDAGYGGRARPPGAPQ